MNDSGSLGKHQMGKQGKQQFVMLIVPEYQQARWQCAFEGTLPMLALSKTQRLNVNCAF